MNRIMILSLCLALLSSYASAEVEFTGMSINSNTVKISKSQASQKYSKSNNSLSIGNYVWFDSNQNGQQDLGELGIHNIKVNLYNNGSCSGTEMLSTLTSDTGYYEFKDLVKDGSSYCIAVVYPNYWTHTLSHYGNKNFDSDLMSMNQEMGKIPNINLLETDMTLDAGLHHAKSNCQVPTLKDGLIGVYGHENSWAKRYSLDVKINDVVAQGFCHEAHDSGPQDGEQYTVHSIDRKGFTASQRDKLSRIFSYMSDPEILTQIDNFFENKDREEFFNFASNTLVWYYSDWDRDFTKVEDNIYNSWWNKYTSDSEKAFFTDIIKTIIAKVEGSDGYVQYPALKVYYLWNEDTTTHQDIIVPETLIVPNETECRIGAYAKANIGDRVWIDKNYNGLQDDSEEGLASVSVSLYNQESKLIAKTVTDKNGIYLFENQELGNYYLQFILPAGYSTTSKSKGNNKCKDSDVDVTGKTVIQELLAGENSLCWDMGVYITPKPKVDLEVSTNGEDADKVTGPSIAFANKVTWNYVVHNTGNVLLQNVVVSDSKLNEVCRVKTLAIGESQTCMKSGKAVEGQYENVGTVTALSAQNVTVKDSDTSHYIGGKEPKPKVDIEVSTNGEDADKVTGPSIAFANKVTWNYVVHNTGNILLQNVVVSDSKLNEVCRLKTLAIGESQTCTKSGKAVEGQYENVGTVTALSAQNVTVKDSDASHYIGGKESKPKVNIEVSTNGEDADTQAQAVELIVGDKVTWKYVVKNIGNVKLSDIIVSDNQEGIICKVTTLDMGASKTCTKIGIVGENPYENIGKVVAEYQAKPIEDIDKSHYITVKKPNSLGTPPKATSDSKAGERCTVVIQDVIANDIDSENDLNISSIAFVTLDGTVGTDSDNDGDIDTLVISEEGTWRVDNEGKVTYTPNNECIGKSPTPIEYFVKDNAKNSSNKVTVSVIYPDLDKAEIGNKVWFDADKNGQQNDGESGLKGLTIELYDANDELNASTITDENGTYGFVNLEAGEYSVKVLVKDGWSITKQNVEGIEESQDSDADIQTGKTTPITVNDGDKNMDIDIGIYQTEKPSIKVLTTTNGGNGMSIVVGDTIKWTYLLTNTGNTVLTNIVLQDDKEGEITDCDASLDRLNPTQSITCEKVGIAILGAYTNIARVTAKDPSDKEVKDEDSGSYIGQDAPVILGSIGDYVWLDSNKDGLQSAGELPLSNIKVILFNKENKKVKESITDTSGKYQFDDVLEGEYQLEFVVPSGYRVTLKAKGEDRSNDSDANSKGRTETLTLKAGQNISEIDMGLYPETVDVGNRIWYDSNKNGLQDALEKENSLSNIGVKLYKENGELVSETKTRASGYYHFLDVIAGNYYIVFDIPDTYKVSPKKEGTNRSADSDADPISGKTEIFTLVAGIDNPTIDMGLYQEAGKVGDRVWYDANKNGIQDAHENGVGEVEVKLYRVGESKSVAETKTSASGIYLFDNVIPAEYYIVFTAPVAYTITDSGKGTDSTDSNADEQGRTENFILSAGSKNSTIDMGVYQNMVSLGDRVWLDTNHDGLQSIGETGVRDVNVTIYSATSDFRKSVFTDENGNYLFTHLSAGEYSVEFNNIPYGHLITTKDVNENEHDLNDSDVFMDKDKKVITEVTLLTPGKHDLSWDMGIYKTVSLPGKAVLGNLVWEDFNKNGIQDIGERGVANVKVELFNNDTDEKVGMVTTDLNGLYEFTSVDPDFNYYVQFTVPAGYVVSPQDQDDDVLDSDTDENGKSDVISVIADKINSTVDMGIYSEGSILGDRVWYDEKDGESNGLQDEGEQGVYDIKVILYNSAGEEVQVTRTNASGEYHFTNVAKGRYSVGFSELPEGYIFTQTNEGEDDEKDSNAKVNGRTSMISVNGKSNITSLDAGIKKMNFGYSSSDRKRGMIGQNVTIDILANDSDGTYPLNPKSVRITSIPEGATLSDDGKTLTVPGEGVWSVDLETGAITFTPEDGFVGDPTAISYGVQDIQGNESTAEVSVNYPPVANDDNVNGEAGKQIVIHVLDNDSNTSSPLERASLRIIDANNDDEVEILVINGEGTWSTNSDGTITFTPENGLLSNPTSIEYTIKEQEGDVSNRARVTIIYPDAVDDVMTIPSEHEGVITLNVANNDSNNTNPATVTLGCTQVGTKMLTIKGEGIWQVGENGVITFTPEDGFNGEPTDIKYTIALISGERSNCANIDIRYELLIRDDRTTMNVGGITVINILSNDFGSIMPESIKLILPSNAPTGSTLSADGKVLTIQGEGEWSVESRGVVKFIAEDGFALVPTPIKYSVEDHDGRESNEAFITLTEGAVTMIIYDDIAEANGSEAIVIDVLMNDRGDSNGSTVLLVNVDGSLSREIVIKNEGRWSVDSLNRVIFTPVAGYTGTPTPIIYFIRDGNGNLSNPATIEISGTCTCEAYEESVPVMTGAIGLVMVIFTLLFGMFLFRKEEKTLEGVMEIADIEPFKREKTNFKGTKNEKY